MGMTRVEKETEIKALNTMFGSEELVVVTHYSGLDMPQMTELRSELRKENATFKVTKNTLAKLALKGTQFEPISDMFTGPTGVAVSKDAVAAAKVAHKFSKANDKLVILGGMLGAKVLDVSEIEALAKLPSLDEIRSKLVGLLVAAPTKLAVILQTPARDLVGVTKAYSEKGE